MIAQIELLDEVNAKINGLSTVTRRKLSDKFSFILPHARHTPAFKMGRWDGKTSFFSIGGKTYINLLEDILPILMEQGYDISVVDNRNKYDIKLDPIDVDHFADRVWPPGHPAAGQPIVLRDYQIEIINRFIENHCGMQEVGTGAGKTLVTAALSDIVEKSMAGEQQVLMKMSTGSNAARTIVIVPNKDLVTQTEEDYVNLGLDVGVYYGDRKEYNRTHTICTWQSLEVIQKNYKSGKSDMSLEDFIHGVVAVIVDEAHMGKADVLKKMLLGPFANLPIRWGLTGTIPKEEHFAVAIKAGIGPTVGNLKSSELQDAGVLSSCDISILQLKDDVVYDSYQSEMKYLVSDVGRIKFLADFIKQISYNENTLVLVNNIKTGNMLVDYLGEEHAVFVSGKLTSSDRKDEYDKFKDGNNKIVIATYGVASCGINIIRINNMVLLEPGKSFVRVIQSIGRGLRKGHDKDHVDIYDICSTAKFSKRHLTERKRFYSESNYPFKLSKVDWK